MVTVKKRRSPVSSGQCTIAWRCQNAWLSNYSVSGSSLEQQSLEKAVVVEAVYACMPQTSLRQGCQTGLPPPVPVSRRQESPGHGPKPEPTLFLGDVKPGLFDQQSEFQDQRR